jgi:hypothetical protein
MDPGIRQDFWFPAYRGDDGSKVCALLSNNYYASSEGPGFIPSACI